MGIQFVSKLVKLFFNIFIIYTYHYTTSGLFKEWGIILPNMG